MARQAAVSSIPPGSRIVCPGMLSEWPLTSCVKENSDCNFTVIVCITHSKIITHRPHYWSFSRNALPQRCIKYVHVCWEHNPSALQLINLWSERGRILLQHTVQIFLSVQGGLYLEEDNYKSCTSYGNILHWGNKMIAFFFYTFFSKKISWVGKCMFMKKH